MKVNVEIENSSTSVAFAKVEEEGVTAYSLVLYKYFLGTLEDHFVRVQLTEEQVREIIKGMEEALNAKT